MGGSSNSAQKQADQNERERQAQIAATTGKINSVFDAPSRQAEYGKLAADTTQFYQSDLDKQKLNNDRALKFALARSGNTGGSVQVDKGRTLGEDYLKGVVEASRKGQAAGANLRQTDESSRMNLLAMAQTGLDATTAGSQAASAIRGNLQAGQADATANSLGDMFTNISDVYAKSEAAKKDRSGYKYGFGSPYTPMYGPGSGT